MHYMENAIRCNPLNLFPEAKTAIMLATPYKQPKYKFKTGYGLVASYARGRDYHKILNKRMKRLMQWFEEQTGQKE